MPLALPKAYSYRVPFELNDFVIPGQRVIVPFGKSKLLTAIIRKVHTDIPDYQTKYLDFILDERPVVTEKQLELWDWISSYYMANIGDVMTAALPSRLKLESETKVLLNEEVDFQQIKLQEFEILIIDALQVRGVLDLKEIGEILDRKTVYPVIKRMLDRNLIYVEEELKELYKPKVEKYVALDESVTGEIGLQEAFERLSRSPKQQEVLVGFLKLSNYYEMYAPVLKKDLLEATNTSHAVLNGLYEKSILKEVEKEVGRINLEDTANRDGYPLSVAQQKAYDDVVSVFSEKDVCLLHGVTGSGKTELFVKLIKDQITLGNKVLYLLPEIALTTQIINRLKKYFGSKIAVYHSRFSPNERVEIWNDILNEKFNKYDVILGARSAVFLPFKKLGLIIVDEEHESSYKQHDPSPRYHARDTAMVLARQFGAKVLLGTATPAIETMYNAEEGHYGYVPLTERFGGLQMPEIQCADLKEATAKNKMHGIFSEFLLKEMKEVLANGKQIILFQNRRGYAPRWVCEMCNHTPECTRCDVSLNYHKYQHLLTCHYCGFAMKPPTRCSACGSTDLKMVGIGTEKIEEEIEIHLGSKVRVQRMDLDTTRSKYAYQNIIDDFENKQIDILVGTQMVTKGLDFDNVALVGILNADDMLFYPDFRAFERAYQLMSQVSGRAGRKGKRGKVIIQSYDPNHWIIQKVMYHDYEGMYKQELYERKNYQYPPFFRMIRLTVRHKEEKRVDVSSLKLVQKMQEKLGNRVLGPEYGSIKRIRNLYNKVITVKFERNASPSKVKEFIADCIAHFSMDDDFKSVRIKVDVDPN
ncbi:MAG: primosomal protein N' [Flavobacteriales bacterium]|nr:primosomal protein N' [Flavobacteriales bacterium]